MSDGISVRDEFEDLLHQLFYHVILLFVETIFELMKNNWFNNMFSDVAHLSRKLIVPTNLLNCSSQYLL